MAQGVVAAMPVAVNGNGASFTAEERREILEYRKIVTFAESVMAGTHPRVKIQPLQQANSNRHVSSPSLPQPAQHTTAPQPVQPIRLESAASYYGSSLNGHSGQNGASTSHAAMSSKSEINPILLEKSDDLIKAEIQLQRVRLERTLREQIEQQRIASKALLQTSESLPNFDLSDVLSKALAIVHPTTAVDPEASTAGASAHSSASDSFDDNTFYSSQHDTPENSPPRRQSRGTRQSQRLRDRAAEVAALSDGELAADSPVRVPSRPQEMAMAGPSISQDNHQAGLAHERIQNLPKQSDMFMSQWQQKSTGNNGSNAVPAPSNNMQHTGKVSIVPGLLRYITINHVPEDGADFVLQNKDDVSLRQAVETLPPVVRAHNLSPFAPQPARVSPLVNRDAPVLTQNMDAHEAQPAQVSALRNQVTEMSSTDSSPKARSPRTRTPKGSKPESKKKEKKKKNKRNKGKGPADVPDSPYIKPEPRSPSPYNSAPLPRPQKRQRQSGNFAAELDYDEPRVISETHHRDRLEGERHPRTRWAREDGPDLEIRRPEPVYREVEREEELYRRVSGVQYARRPESPAVFALPYAPVEGRAVRAMSHAIIDRPQDEPRYYREPAMRASVRPEVEQEPRYYREPVIRASVRPDADRERSRSPIRDRRSPLLMGPPRQAMRLMMDEYGRKFYEAVPTSSTRQSVAPPIRYRDSPEIIYERAPVRPVSSRVPVEVYEEDGVMYERPPPPAGTSRREVTQPEYAIPAQPDYRSYRQREYSVRPTAMGLPREEFIQLRAAAPARRQMSVFEDAPPREYIQRAPSVRPEPVRYEIPREYAGRLQSVPPPREYAASVRPEALSREYASVLPEGVRREVMPREQREYSVRPEVVERRERVIVPEGERYYEEMPRGRPVEGGYLERPRAREASVAVYADEGRREVYR